MGYKTTIKIILLCIICLQAIAQPMLLYKGESSVNFLEYAQIIADTSGLKKQLSLEQITKQKFVSLDKAHVSNCANNTHWLRLTVRNEIGEATKCYFSFGYSNEDITLYKLVNGKLTQTKKAGTDYALYNKEVKIGREELILLNFEPNETADIYIKINNTRGFAKQFFTFSFTSFNLYSEAAFDQNFIQIKLINSFFYGALFIMFFYNLILALSLKSRSYLFYAIFIFLYSIFNAATDGLTTELLLANHIYIDRLIRLFVAPAMMVCYVFFARSYMQTGKHLPTIDKFMLGGALLLILNYVLFFAGYWGLGRDILFVTIGCVLLLVFIASILSIKTNKVPGLYFTGANSLLLLSGVIYILYLANIIPHNQQTRHIEYLIQICSLLQVALFSLGLSHRVKSAETELAYQKVVNEKEMQNVIEQKNLELEYKVSERTMELSLQKHQITAINEQLEHKVRERTKKLQKAYRDLLNLNYELDSFIYRAAHDIRGPITTIMGLCNLALLEKDFDKCQEYILILDKYSKTTQITLNRILGVNDLKNNHIKLTHFSISALKDGVMALMINNLDYTKVNITFELPEDDDMYSDQYLMQVILQNMIDNAIRFRKTKSNMKPSCHVIIEKNEHGVRISISDNGEGIDVTIKDKIFDMFYRGSEYSSGSGLGLYIVKIAVKKLNGTIDLMNRIDDTVFDMNFPYFKDKTVQNLSSMYLQTPVN